MEGCPHLLGHSANQRWTHSLLQPRDTFLITDTAPSCTFLITAHSPQNHIPPLQTLRKPVPDFAKYRFLAKGNVFVALLVVVRRQHFLVSVFFLLSGQRGRCRAERISIISQEERECLLSDSAAESVNTKWRSEAEIDKCLALF